MGRGLIHGHTEVRGRPRTGAQAFSPSSHPTFPPSMESRNLRHNIYSPQQLLRFGEQWTKELNAHRDSAIVLVQPLPSHPAKTSLPILTAAPGAPGACHLLILVTTHAACPSLWAMVKPRVDPESWGCQALLSQTGISGRGEERDKGLPLAEHLLGARGGAKTSSCVVSIHPLNSSCLGEQDDTDRKLGPKSQISQARIPWESSMQS